MMNIREYFNKLYSEDWDNGEEIESKVWDWYNNDEEKFYNWAEENNIDLDAITYMMNGDQEYVLTLWVWDMEDE